MSGAGSERFGQERFGTGARRLAGAAAVLLGWRPAEFWAATPAELATALGALAGEDGAGAAAGPGDLARLQELHPDG